MARKITKKITKKNPVPEKATTQTAATKKRVNQKAKKLAKKPTAFKFEVQNKILLSAYKALKVLNSRQKGNSKDLLSMNEESLVYMTVLVNKLPEKMNIKPIRVALDTSIYANATKKFCMICSNEFKARFKTVLKGEEFSNWKFLTFDKLRRNFKTFQEKRDLLEEFELFFCEGRVYMLIKKMLGKGFYSKKKYPYPIEFNDCLVNKSKLEMENEEEEEEESVELPESVDNLAQREGTMSHLENFDAFDLDTSKLVTLLKNLTEECTYFYQGNGPEYTLKVGRVSEDAKNLPAIKNIKLGLKNMMKYMLTQELKLKDIRRISLKLAQSESLPVYSYLTPEEVEFMQKVEQ